MGREFIPKSACTAASGACFYSNRCLGRCTTRLPAAIANEKLTEALGLLRPLHEYTLTFRSITRYVDGSEIDVAMQKTGRMLKDLRQPTAKANP